MDFNEIKTIPAKSHIDEYNVKGELKFIPANNKQGFNFDYVLYIPNTIKPNTTLIVEGANTSGGRLSDLKEAIEKVRNDSDDCDLPIYEDATRLGMPILYPIFPRWFNGEEVIYNHMLSSNSLNSKTKRLKESGLERVDLQLIKMIEDAKKKFASNGINIEDKIIIDGYSASSKFANRFTLLHPELVKMCIGGAFSGQLTLPMEEINGEKLLWPIGLGNLEELIGSKLSCDQIKLFKEIPQFYYIGAADDNDPFVPDPENENMPLYRDIIKPDEAKQLYEFIGYDMIRTRLPKIQQLYDELGINVVFKIYKDKHHKTTLEEAKEDISQFIDDNLTKIHIK